MGRLRRLVLQDLRRYTQLDDAAVKETEFMERSLDFFDLMRCVLASSVEFVVPSDDSFDPMPGAGGDTEIDHFLPKIAHGVPFESSHIL